jgi:hypothetical protein
MMGVTGVLEVAAREVDSAGAFGALIVRPVAHGKANDLGQTLITIFPNC